MRSKRVLTVILCVGLSAFATSAMAAQKWGKFGNRKCVAIGKSQKSAILWNIPWGRSWEAACASYRRRGGFWRTLKCENKGGHMWGTLTLNDHNCPRWGRMKNNLCVEVRPGIKVRSFSAVLHDIPWGYNWLTACKNKGAVIRWRGKSYTFRRPFHCVKTNAGGIITGVGLAAGLAIAYAAHTASAGTVSPWTGPIVATTVYAVNQATGGGALNMWGVFHVADGSCR